MAMVSADGSSQSFGRLTARIGWFGLRVGGHPALSPHSSNEPGELSQRLCHDDRAINIVSNIIIFSGPEVLFKTCVAMKFVDDEKHNASATCCWQQRHKN